MLGSGPQPRFTLLRHAFPELCVTAVGVLAVVSVLLSSNGCDFFVDPVLTGMAVGPSATIQTGNTVQMNAVGTFNDGSQNDLKSSTCSGAPIHRPLLSSTQVVWSEVSLQGRQLLPAHRRPQVEALTLQSLLAA